MLEDYPDKLLLVNMVPFSHSLQAVNLESDWLLFEGSQPRKAPHTKKASDYRPRFKVNIEVSQQLIQTVSFVFYCAAHVHVSTFYQTTNLTGGKKKTTSQLLNCFADINQKVGCCDDNKFLPILRIIAVWSFSGGIGLHFVFSSFEVWDQEVLKEDIPLAILCLLIWSLSQIITQPALTYSVAASG